MSRNRWQHNNPPLSGTAIFHFSLFRDTRLVAASSNNLVASRAAPRLRARAQAIYDLLVVDLPDR